MSSRYLTFLLCALAGYALVMLSNPARTSFRDGWRAVRRYPALILIPGLFGFCAALFQLAQRIYFWSVMPPETRPVFSWVRAAWRDPDYWFRGTPESLWWLPHTDLLEALQLSWMPAFESLAATFNCLVPTFPLSALAAIVLLLNRGGHHAVLWRALRKRLGSIGWLVHLAILGCALAAVVKPLLYIAPPLFRLGPEAMAWWFQWSPVVVWLSFLFEYLFGLFVQIYLILLAFIWVRGLTFTREHLIDFALRRFSSVVKWAAVVLLLSSIFIDAPLILKNFPAFAGYFPAPESFGGRLTLARAVLAVFLLLAATMQITLVFHSESLGAAFRDHRAFLQRHAWPFAWFLLVAGVHCYLLYGANLSIARGLGEGTSFWVAWSLLFPWLAGAVAGWLLASWVCLYKRCSTPAQTIAAQAMFKF